MHRFRLLVSSAVAAALLLWPALAPVGATGGHDEVLRFTVDVAEDFSRFVPTPVNPGDTEPVRGSFFLTDGNIFPAGTIRGDGSTFDPNQPGSIGKWTCRGTHLVDFAEIIDPDNPAPIWVTTHQIYETHGLSIMTDGVEGAVPVVRTVTGATGLLRGYIGEQRQVFLGLNSTGGVNLRVTFILRRATH